MAHAGSDDAGPRRDGHAPPAGDPAPAHHVPVTGRAASVPAAAAGASDPGASLRDVAGSVGLERVRVVAWRDLDDPEAGGSELHAHRIAALWAAAGLDVAVRTSAVPGGPETVVRQGYRVVRRSGRYAVFADTIREELRRRHGPGEGLVEVWNGMPFFSPLWYRGPRVVFLHHVHAEMWRMVLPGWLARVGEEVERRVAPPLYRSSRVVTLSESSRQEICDMLGLRPDRVTVASPGVGSRFRPGPGRSPVPLVVAVGRLVPVKRFDLLFRALARARETYPDLEAAVLGEGYERPRLEALRRSLGAEGWLALPGRVTDDELVDWYRRAWVVASTSLREGWGMTLTEAAACGTPAVATDIAGHRDAVVDGRTGFLADGADSVAAAIAKLVGDRGLRAVMGHQALERSRSFTWDATARATLEALAGEVGRRPAR
ncbi:MAG: glycosyltransferase family 4 protein [Acidimicrobiales bacterium]